MPAKALPFYEHIEPDPKDIVKLEQLVSKEAVDKLSKDLKSITIPQSEIELETSFKIIHKMSSSKVYETATELGINEPIYRTPIPFRKADSPITLSKSSEEKYMEDFDQLSDPHIYQKDDLYIIAKKFGFEKTNDTKVDELRQLVLGEFENQRVRAMALKNKNN